MKKKYLVILLALFLLNCENSIECIESSGEFITKEISVTPFTRIEVHKGIEVIIKEAPVYKVSIYTGENLLENIQVQQNGEILTLKDLSTCNWVREYGITKVYISAPNLTEIYSKSDKNITSDGVLNYPILKLYAMDSNGDKQPGAGTSDFILNCNSNTIEIHANNLARFYLQGTAENASFNLYFGDSRIEAPALKINNLYTYHRGSNDLITFPINSIKGKILSTGNVILKNNPPLVDVQVGFMGQLIYN